jgi:FkbM family methyltransferase
MYHRFSWTSVSHRRNGISAEYEPLQPYFLLALIEQAECRTFADVGANIGAYSVLASQAASIEHLVAFEANPAAAGEVRRNFALNGIRGIVREVAVSTEPGTVTFGTVSRFAGNSAVVETSAGQAFHKTTPVEAVTLDSELSGYPQPIAIKIDVEGHERNVLAGAKNVLASARSIIQVEDYAGTIADAFPEGYRILTRIGPDWYFTNIPDIDPAGIYERAATALIEANHENKAIILRKGDFGIEISGTSYKKMKRLAYGLMRKYL